MKIKLHITPAVSVRELIATHSRLERLCANGIGARIVLWDDDPLVSELFALCASFVPRPRSGGITINRCLGVSTEYHFDPEEWASIQWFEVLSEKVWKLPKRDDQSNRTSFLRQEPTDRGGWAPIRVGGSFCYSRDDIPLSEILCIGGEWADEYVVGRDVETVFSAREFSGARFTEVLYGQANESHPSLCLLASDGCFAPAIKAATAWDRSGRDSEGNDPMTRFLRKGLICAEHDKTLSATADFFRTADPIAPNNGAGWIVGRRVLESYVLHQFTGWMFGPVLISGSTLYDEYTNRTNQIDAWIRTNRFNAYSKTFGGGRSGEVILKVANQRSTAP